jgi:hypothetical protein
MRELTELERFEISCDYMFSEGWKEEITQWFEENKELFERSDRNPYVFYVLENSEGVYSVAWLTIGAFDLDKKVVAVIEIFGCDNKYKCVVYTKKQELLDFYKETLGKKISSAVLWKG